MRRHPTTALARILFIILVSSATAIGCRLATDPEPIHFGSGGRKILFVGNSLSGFNDLGGMVVALAESAKVSPAPSADVYWLPDYALIDHWVDGRVQKLIADGHYDVVIMQQGPTSVEINRDTLRLAAKLFSPGIRAAGGIPALLNVWPTINRLQDFDRATQSYQLAAQDVSGMLLPGGETWRAAWRRDPALQGQLYSSDGLHPSMVGSYAVALSIVGMLYDRSAVGLPSRIRLSTGSVVSVDPATAATLQLAADEANQKYGSKGSR